MEYYLSIAGETSGPHSQFYVIERIRSGELLGEELIWYKEAPEWAPLSQASDFTPYWPLTEEARSLAESARQLARIELDRPRPWLRFWARMIDYVWFIGAVTFLLVLLFPDAAEQWPKEPQLWQHFLHAALTLAFVPVEAFLISRYGTTPGKSLLCIQVCRSDDGKLPSFRQAFRRAILVYLWGIGAWLHFLIAVIAMSWSRAQLQRHKISSWDQINTTRVEHGEPDIWRYVVLSGIVLLILAFVVFAVVQTAQHLSG